MFLFRKPQPQIPLNVESFRNYMRIHYPHFGFTKSDGELKIFFARNSKIKTISEMAYAFAQDLLNEKGTAILN